MLTLSQMEEYASLLIIIDQYKRMTSQDGLRALSYDKPAGPRYYKPDTIGESVAQHEERHAKLAYLEGLAAAKRPEVEKTIKAAAALRIHGAVKIELALRMRYLNGRRWKEVSELLNMKDPEGTVAAALHRLEEMERKI